MYGYEAGDWPIDILVNAFEVLASRMIGPRETATFDGLVHPVHLRGSVHAWEITNPG
jgi:hypothetical protein